MLFKCIFRLTVTKLFAITALFALLTYSLLVAFAQEPGDFRLFLPLIVMTGSGGSNDIPTDPNFKVAFIGDSGDGSNFQSVLSLIQSENVDLVLHQGDFSYDSTADIWISKINDTLGSDLPYLGSDGNHDDWTDYALFFQDRVAKMGLDPNIVPNDNSNYTLAYRGLKMVFVKEPGDDPDFIAQSLVGDNHIWKICSWHHNMNDMQAGGKGDSVGWPSYQTCQDDGAIIATGHEHSYARTYTLTGLHSNDNHPVLGLPGQLIVSPGDPGKTFVFVSGLGGASKRDYHADEHDDDGWWAAIYTSNRYCQNTCTDLAANPPQQDKSNDISTYNYDYGALFITFHVDGDPRKASGYFKNILGEIIDEFEIIAP